jgi:hypothetical protein
MIVISDACTIKSQMIVNDASWIVIDDSRVMLQIVLSLTDNSVGIICDGNMYIVKGC